MGQPSLFIVNKLNFSMFWSDLCATDNNYTLFFNIKRFLKLFFKLFFEDSFVASYYFLKAKNETFADFLFDFIQLQENIFITRHFKKIFFGNLWIYKLKNSYVISLAIFFNMLQQITKHSLNKASYISTHFIELFYLQSKNFKKTNTYFF